MIDHRIEAYYRVGDTHDPVLLSTDEDVDSLIDSLLSGLPLHDAALLLSRARPKLPSGSWDHELYIGVSREQPVGALMLATQDQRIASAGAANSRTGVAYLVATHWTEFPDHSEIPASLVREAVKEFLHSGGQVPTCIEWKSIEDPEGDYDDPWGE